MRRFLLFSVAIGFSLLWLACVRVVQPQPQKLTEEAKAEYLKKLESGSGLQLSGSTELIYHNKHTDRHPFSEVWILFSVTGFDIKSLKLRKAPLDMNESYEIENLSKVITSCIPADKIEGPTGSQAFDWTTGFGQYNADLLRTRRGHYLYVHLFPKKA